MTNSPPELEPYRHQLSLYNDTINYLLERSVADLYRPVYLTKMSEDFFCFLEFVEGFLDVDVEIHTQD